MGTNELPVEIIDLILNQFKAEMEQTTPTPENAADQPFFKNTAISELLSLRLINKSWSIAIIPHVYRNISLSGPSMIECFKETWSHSAIILSTSHIQRLCFDQVEYPNLRFKIRLNKQLPDRTGEPKVTLIKRHRDFSSSMMKDVENIIRLCSSTLHDLKFSFYGAVGFSASMIDAVKQVDNLDKLIIEGSPFGIDVNHLDSIKGLLKVTPRLRSLSLNFSYLDRMKIDPGSLSDLEHLFVMCDRSNLDAITQLCKSQGKNIKYLEYIPYDGHKRPDPVIRALKDSLEYLFLAHIPTSLPRGVLHETFPKLKVIRCIEATCMGTNFRWLQLKLFQNMEILVTSYAHSKDVWSRMLETRAVGSFAKPINFKHIVFTAYNHVSTQDQELVRNFEKHGIQCHFKCKWTYLDIPEELARVDAKDEGCESEIDIK